MKVVLCLVTLLVVAPQLALAQDASSETSQMHYVLVRGKNPDVDGFGPYSAATAPLRETYGWKRIVMNTPGSYAALEGEAENETIVIFEVPSEEAIYALWNSPEYQEAKKLREGLAEFQVLVLDGFDPSAVGN